MRSSDLKTCEEKMISSFIREGIKLLNDQSRTVQWPSSSRNPFICYAAGAQEPSKYGYQRREVTIDEKMKAIEELRGWDRVEALGLSLFTKSAMMDVGVLAAWTIGFLYGAVVKSIDAPTKYLAKTAEKLFDSQHYARMHAKDNMWIAVWKVGTKFGIKVALLTGGMLSVFLLSAAYRNEVRITDQIIGTAALTMLWRFPAGPKQALASGVIGIYFGIFWGLASKLGFWATGLTVDQMLRMNFETYMHLQRSLGLKAAFLKRSDGGDVDLLKLMDFHNESNKISDQKSTSLEDI